jgi:hypothetical protein
MNLSQRGWGKWRGGSFFDQFHLSGPLTPDCGRDDDIRPDPDLRRYLCPSGLQQRNRIFVVKLKRSVIADVN